MRKERINFEVRKGFIKVGTASIDIKGIVSLDEKDLYYMVYEVNCPLLYYQRKDIYANMNTLLPYKVLIKQTTMGISKEKTQIFNQDKHIVISQEKGEEKKEMVFSQEIQDSIWVIFYLQSKNLKVGNVYSIAVPTGSFIVKVKKMEEISTSKVRNHKALFIDTEPREVRVWVTTDGKNSILKIIYNSPVGDLVLLPL